MRAWLVPLTGTAQYNHTTAFTSGKLLSFMETLSPEQRVLFEQLGAPMGVEPPDLGVDMMDTGQGAVRDEAFYNLKPSVASQAEVFVLSTLLVASKGRKDLDKWLLEAETDRPRMDKLGDEWAPLPNSVTWNSQGKILLSLESSLKQYVQADGGNGTIETVARIAELWDVKHIMPASIDGYLRELRRPHKPKDRRPQGPKRDGGRSSSARHVAAIPAIVAFLREHRQLLRASFYRHRITVVSERNVSKAELVEMMEEEREEHAVTLHALEVEHEMVVAERDAERDVLVIEHKTALAAKQATVDTARKAASKAQVAKAKVTASIKGTAKRVREEEHAKLPEMAAAKVAHANALRKQALAEKRDFKAKFEEADRLATSRLKERKRLKEANKSLALERDELLMDAVEAEAKVTEHAEAWALVQMMPSWGKARAVGTGRGGVQFEYDHRITIYQMIANGTPLSAIGPNICAVLNRTAPWLEPEVPSPRVLKEARFELRMIEECLAARRVASAYAIRMLGFDETTKNGNPALTSNVIIEATRGAKLEPVILRGAYCSAGGTSELLASAIETKCFERLRDFLRRWKAKFEAMYPKEKWTGPEADELSMGRLAGGGALQSDTCNTAEKAKALLAEKIAEQAREKIGEEVCAAPRSHLPGNLEISGNFRRTPPPLLLPD